MIEDACFSITGAHKTLSLLGRQICSVHTWINTWGTSSVQPRIFDVFNIFGKYF